MAILLVAEHDNKTLNAATHKALTAAKAISPDVHILVVGQGARGVAEAAAKLDGVKAVKLAESGHLEHQLAEEMAGLIVPMMAGYDTVVAAATATGKNFMPRVAALLDVAQISEITAVISPDTFERPIYAGNAIQTVQSTDAKKVITIRTAGFAATGEGGSAPIESVTGPAAIGLSTWPLRSAHWPASAPVEMTGFIFPPPASTAAATARTPPQYRAPSRAGSWLAHPHFPAPP